MCPALGEVQDSSCLRSTAQTQVESSHISDRASKTGLPCLNKRRFCTVFWWLWGMFMETKPGKDYTVVLKHVY